MGPIHSPTQWVPRALSLEVTHLHLVPWSRMAELYYTSTPPIRLHGVMLNHLSTGTTLPFYLY
jgi:hypothetical protein